MTAAVVTLKPVPRQETSHEGSKHLPTDPTDTFPLEAIKDVATAKKFDSDPYLFGIGDFQVVLITPTLKYRIETEAEREAAKSKEKRTKKEGAVQGTFKPFDEFRNWAEYVGEYKPVLIIRAMPKLAESFWGAVGRGVAANYGIHAPAKLHFKADFYRMKLTCGDKIVQAIHPGKIAHVLNESNYFVSVKDATFEGLYFYPANAISSSCGEVKTEIYSEKEPNKAETKTLSTKTITRVAEDFDPYLKTRERP